MFLGENSHYRNRDIHISGSFSSTKCQNENKNGTLDVTLDEMAVLNLLKSDGKLTQNKIGELIGKSDKTVKHITASLEEKKYIECANGKRFGYWKVNIDTPRLCIAKAGGYYSNL